MVAFEHEDGSGSYAKTENGKEIFYVKPPYVDYTRYVLGWIYLYIYIQLTKTNHRENVVGWRKTFLEKRRLEIEAFLNFLDEREKTPRKEASNLDLIDLEKIHFGGEILL